MVKYAHTVGMLWLAMETKNRANTAPITVGNLFRCLSDPKGWARFHSNFRRREASSDSGKEKKPKITLLKLNTAAATKGVRNK